jgi:hypothetical protein
LDRFDYSVGVASTEASGVSVGFTVAFGVALTLPFALAEGDAVSVAAGVADGVAFTALFISWAARRFRWGEKRLTVHLATGVHGIPHPESYRLSIITDLHQNFEHQCAKVMPPAAYNLLLQTPTY